ncbi:MAG: hypothetical protein ACXAB2_08200 [Candidatus Hodarchaeales archaeon]|jgi:hypothetical protein
MSIQQNISTSLSNENLMYIAAFIIGLLGNFIVITQLNGKTLPFISDDRTAFLVLGSIGFIMCTMVMGKAVGKYGFFDPLVLISSIIGIIMTIMILMVIFKIDIPYLASDYDAFLVLAALFVIKILLTNFQKLSDILGIFH